MTGRAPSDARVRRVALEEDLRTRWRRLCDPTVTGVDVSELAERHLGVRRNDLYETFAGPTHARLAWLELLPASAELVHLRERSLVHGFELASSSEEHATLGDVVGRAGGLLAALATSEADGFISPAEALTDIAAIERLEAVLSRAKATRRAAIERRGMRVAGSSGR